MRASSGRRRRGILAVLVVTVIGCAHNPAPGAWLSPPFDAQSDPYGAWVDVSTGDTTGVAGEFLAVERDSIFVLSLDSTVHAVPTAHVVRAQLAFYDARWGDLALWSALGAVSTISNGVLLVFTFPTWVIGGTIAAASDSRAPIRKVTHAEEWEGVRMYARFPAGMPENLPRRLPPKPVR